MDTTESMKSDTPQPSVKEPSPQKEPADNNIAGMYCLNSIHFHIHTSSILSAQYKSRNSLIFTNHAFEYVFD